MARALFLTPELGYLEALFLPDLSRARLAGAILARAAGTGGTPALDLATTGLDAAATAAAAARAGVERASVAAGPWEGTCLEILTDAFAARDIPVDPYRPDLPIPQASDPTRALPPPGGRGFLILPRPVPVPAGIGAFTLREPNVLTRVAPGGGHGIDHTVDRIVLIAPDQEPPPAANGTVVAPALPTAADGVEAFLALAHRIADLHGPGALRLVGAAAPPPGRDGAAWGRRLGLHEPVLRRALTELVTRHLPGTLAEWNHLVRLYDLAVDPLEEMFAGNNLADRNRDLIVNIVP